MTSIVPIELDRRTRQPSGKKLAWAVTASLLVHACSLWGLAACYPRLLTLPEYVSVGGSSETILLNALPNERHPREAHELLEESAVTILPHQAIMGSHVFHYTDSADVTLAELLANPTEELTLVENIETGQENPHSQQPVIPLLVESLDFLSEDAIPETTTSTAPVATTSTQGTESSQQLTPPDLNGNVLPRYPEQARRLGWEGRVLLRIWINKQGSVTKVHVEQSSGYSLLDAAAVTNVRTWRVKPAQRNGQPVAGSWLLPIRFRQQP